MPYTADVSRSNPACFLFLIDQSRSMSYAFAGRPGELKMDQAAAAVNRILGAVCKRCSRGSDVRNYFDIGVIGYCTDERGDPIIRSVLPGTFPDQPFLPIDQVSDVADVEERRVKESDGDGGLVEVTRRTPIWLYPHAEYGTPMCAVFEEAAGALENWVAGHPCSFPPIVINVSDGAASDGDPELAARRIMGIQTGDGNVLIFNVHLSGVSATPVEYPDREDVLPHDDGYARLMFRMSSVLPESSLVQASSMGFPVSAGSRGYVFNADMEALVQFLEIGTRAALGLH